MVTEGRIVPCRFTGEVSASQMVIEPLEEFSERYALGVATTIMDLNKQDLGKLRVLNPSKFIVKIAKGPQWEQQGHLRKNTKYC